MLLVIGPPGTGKTRAAAAAVSATRGTNHFSSSKNVSLNGMTNRLSTGNRPVLKMSSFAYLASGGVEVFVDFERVSSELALRSMEEKKKGKEVENEYTSYVHHRE